MEAVARQRRFRHGADQRQSGNGLFHRLPHLAVAAQPLSAPLRVIFLKASGRGTSPPFGRGSTSRASRRASDGLIALRRLLLACASVPRSRMTAARRRLARSGQAAKAAREGARWGAGRRPRGIKSRLEARPSIVAARDSARHGSGGTPAQVPSWRRSAPERQWSFSSLAPSGGCCATLERAASCDLSEGVGTGNVAALRAGFDLASGGSNRERVEMLYR